jgi:D-alanyl-D-alanine carboxypeptidase/D-alanyl-D-alanine-endopeptidase (penicillin-binding protein 4)
MMKKNISFLLLAFCITSFQVLNAQELYKQNHSLNTALKVLKYDKDLKNAGVGFYAVDINSGEVLSMHNQDLSLTPASVMKLLTTATALENLGPEFRFETTIQYSGSIDLQTKILDGNIFIKGGGDPTLGSKYFSETATHLFLDLFVKKISEKGIQYINGKIIGDASLYGDAIVPATWSWEDIGNYFGAGPCGLSIYDNMYTLWFNTGPNVGDSTHITKIEPEIPGLEIENHVISDRVNSDRSYIFGAPYTYFRYINGELPLNRTDYKVKGSLPDPAYFTAYELKKELKQYKIGSGEATSLRIEKAKGMLDTMKRFDIYTMKSPALKHIITQTNFRSINLFAEHLLRHSQLKASNYDINKINKNFIEDYWNARGISSPGMRVYDGSGLSKYNTVTAKQVVSILKYMRKKSKYSEAFYESIPVVGKSGTVKYICKGTSAVNNMRAKSGSIKSVRAYAGYVTTKSGRQVAFALLINNYNGSSSNTRKKMEKLMTAISDFNL